MYVWKGFKNILKFCDLTDLNQLIIFFRILTINIHFFAVTADYNVKK